MSQQPTMSVTGQLVDEATLPSEEVKRGVKHQLTYLGRLLWRDKALKNHFKLLI